MALGAILAATAGCGRPAAMDRLAQAARLAPAELDGAVHPHVVRRPPLGAAGLGDPRTDAGALNVALKELASNSWRVGYASLVRKAGKEPRIGWRGPVERSVRIGAEDRTGSASDPDVESLVADLLGATLVDAQDELWTAWNALERAGSPEPARTWLTGPPPWPPASIEKYLKRDGENAMALIETLAAEVSPQPAERGWLIRSWLSPPRIVDQQLLTEMARAADGALCREPRFRAWLRAEWTASARQRYRRVARLVASTMPDSGCKRNKAT